MLFGTAMITYLPASHFPIRSPPFLVDWMFASATGLSFLRAIQRGATSISPVTKARKGCWETGLAGRT